MKLPSRKPNRLKAYDYSLPGVYFVTICAKNKENVLCEIVGDDAHIVPKLPGRIAEKYLKTMTGIDKYVIMPNHIHIMLVIDGPMKASAPTQSVSQLVKSFKILVTKEVGVSVFQRSFHDHIVRNEHDYQRIWQYIDTNPAKWREDCFYRET